MKLSKLIRMLKVALEHNGDVPVIFSESISDAFANDGRLTFEKVRSVFSVGNDEEVEYLCLTSEKLSRRRTETLAEQNPDINLEFCMVHEDQSDEDNEQ